MGRPRKNKRLLAELTAHKFHPSLAGCDFWFSIINDEVFCNKLNPINFDIRRLRGVWGYYDDETGIITLSNVFTSKELFLNVLAHEMVHVYQHQQGMDLSHGDTFWEWREKFKRNGLVLAEIYDQGHSIVRKK